MLYSVVDNNILKQSKVRKMKKTLVRIVAIVLILVSVLTVCAPAFADTNIPVGSEATVTNKQGEARVRKSPDKNSGKVITLPQGATVKVLSKVTGKDKYVWYKVSGTQYGQSFTGYIRHDYLTKKSSSGTTTPKWKQRYGEKLFTVGSVPKAEQTHFANMIADLQAWAKKTEDPYRTQYGGKYIWDNYAHFRNMSGLTKFDVNVELSVRLFQELTPVLKVDGKVGDQTKQALYNETH